MNDPTGHCADPASGTMCMVLAPTGPVGWFVIGILLLVDVVLIGVVIEDLAQNHTPPMSTVNSNQSHTPPIETTNRDLRQQSTSPIESQKNNSDSTHTQPFATSGETITHTSPLSTDQGAIIILQAKTEAQILKSIRSLEKQINLHEEKIQSYIENPDSHDNKGFLANANEVLRNKIIESRIRNLQNEIKKFQNEINKLQGQLNKMKYHIE